MRDLHAELQMLEVEWPETPDLAGAVLAAVPARRAPLRRRRRARLLARPALVFAALALALAGTAVALDLFDLRGASVKRGPVTASPTPRSGLGDDLDLGRPSTRVPAALRFRGPTSLGAPDATYVDDGPPGPRISYVYRERPGIPRASETGVALLITVFQGTFTPAVEKTVGQGVRAERLRIDGQPALRLSGAPHGFAYLGANGEFAFEEQRLAAPTLLVERGELLIRIEGRLSRARAVELAREFVVGP
jgi:hypothetical protein